MKLQPKHCEDFCCFSVAVNSRARMAGDTQSISQSDHSYYQSGLPSYWRTNYYLLDRPCYLSLVDPAQLTDRIEDNLLTEHREVIIQQLLPIENSLPGYQTSFFLFQQPLTQISQLEFDNFFFEHLVEFSIFQNWEAEEFKQYLHRRKDYKQLYLYFVDQLDKTMRLQITYLFYIGIKLLDQLHQEVKPTTSELEYQIDYYLENNVDTLKEKLTCLGFSDNFQIHIKKIIFTMLLALVGIFNNKFFNQKIEYLTSIRMQENHAFKKLKILNSKPKIQRHFFDEEQEIMPRKKIKVSPY